MSDNNDDINIEFEDDVVAEGGQKDKLKKLKEQLATARDEAKTNLDGWQRSRADYVNLQKALDQERIDIRKRATEGVILDLLPAIDTFDMAMKDADTWQAVDEKWRMGVEYIYSQLTKTLEGYDVQPIDDITEHFDPNRHEPLETVDTDDQKQDGTLIDIMQKGYEMNGKIIRPAKVKVYKFNE